MPQPKEMKYKMKYTPVLFNFKTKKVEFGEAMTAEIIINDKEGNSLPRMC
jgi:hypothetical protein